MDFICDLLSSIIYFECFFDNVGIEYEDMCDIIGGRRKGRNFIVCLESNFEY